MFLRPSPLNIASLLCALIPAVIPLGGCVASAPVPPPTAAAVPIATWVARGIPGDTVIRYHFRNDFLQYGSKSEIRISADGSATYEWGPSKTAPIERHAGQLSPEALKRVVLAFEENGFFALTNDRGCVTDMTQPPAPSTDIEEWTDADEIFISITINGISKRIDAGGCKYLGDNGAWDRFHALRGVLVNAVKDLPLATPSP